MKIEDVNKIEQSLGVKLPGELVDKYLSDFLDGIEEFPEMTGYFIMDPDLLIKINLRLRKHGLQKRPFHYYYYAIGYNYKTNYYLIDLRETPIKVYCVENNRTWEYRPDNLSDNLLLSLDPGLNSYLQTYVLSHFNWKREEKARLDANNKERKQSADDIYAFLEKIQERARKVGDIDKNKKK